MIEKIVENWLTKSSERSYQLPFCFLLQQEGKTVVNLTRHNSMEHGKDVIAIDGKGEVHAYQLKGVSGTHFTLSDWQSIQNQVLQLIFTPISHPAIPSSGRQHKSYLVINGDINEQVQHAIYVWNVQQEKTRGPEYRLEVIVKGQILEMALKHKDQLVPSEFVEVKNLLELYLRDGREFLNKDSFSNLLENVLNLKRPKSNQESIRLVSSTALVCSLASSSYNEANKRLAVVEAWTIYVFSILRHCELYQKSIKQYKNEISLAQKIISNAMLDLLTECKQNADLFQGNPMIDAFVLKSRKTILLGVSAFFGLTEEVSYEEVHELISAHINDMEMWGESAVPFFLAVYFFYKSNGKKELAATVLTKAFSKAMDGITNAEIPFTDIYTSAEDSVVRILSASDNERFSPRISRILEPLIALASQPDLRHLTEKHWPEISRCIFTELRINNTFDFYLWRINNAEVINKHPENPQSWQVLLEQAKIYEPSKIPPGIKELKTYLPLFLMVFPQRLDADLVKWYCSDN
ncbi:hypothetical protein HRH25_20680 [Flavisolibacter sp. BT320]|nr:hypothetical protein [Flavisolibacter longurius]